MTTSASEPDSEENAKPENNHPTFALAEEKAQNQILTKTVDDLEQQYRNTSLFIAGLSPTKSWFSDFLE